MAMLHNIHFIHMCYLSIPCYVLKKETLHDFQPHRPPRTAHKKNIRNALISLLSEKELSQITVKELSERQILTVKPSIAITLELMTFWIKSRMKL